MEIDLQTRIGALLDAYPNLEETLLKLSPAFAKLRNPVLRRTVAKVATIQQAAKIAGVSPVVMVQTLRKAVGLAAEDIEDVNNNEVEEQPDWFDEAKISVRFDARPIIEAGQSPMSEILRLSKEMEKEKIMELIAPFRPEPIMDLLKSKGFQVWYKDDKCYFFKHQ